MGRLVAMGCNPTVVRGPVQPGLINLAVVNELTVRQIWQRQLFEKQKSENQIWTSNLIDSGA
jgi:hypothetical protein